MPIYWFALSQTDAVNTTHAIAIFIILHLLVYPASNGYNSYMDRDTGSIGGVKNPKLPTKQLFYVSVAFDAIALLASVFISMYFSIALLLYILASRAYSYRGIRLKKYPIIGYATVIIFQGAVTYFMVYHGCSANKTLDVSWQALLAASLLIGGFYPLTQIYQHQQDKADGVITLSIVLGLLGTFVFTAIVYMLAMAVLGYYLISTLQINSFYILQAFFFPVLVYFFWWFSKVYKNHSAANFVYTMQMNLIASVCSNAAFITVFLIEKI
jgi:1,4-dihydroxy-2-naphthoate polyprenyltransferase